MGADGSASSLPPGLAGAGFSPLPGASGVGQSEPKKKQGQATKDILGMFVSMSLIIVSLAS